MCFGRILFNTTTTASTGNSVGRLSGYTREEKKQSGRSGSNISDELEAENTSIANYTSYNQLITIIMQHSM